MKNFPTWNICFIPFLRPIRVNYDPQKIWLHFNKVELYPSQKRGVGDSRHKLQAKIKLGGYLCYIIQPQSSLFANNFWHELTKKSRTALEMAILTTKIKNFHKSKVDGHKKLSTGARLFYDLLHFRGCPFTKPQFSQKALNRIHFFQLFWHCHISQEAWESKLEIAYFFNITFRE